MKTEDMIRELENVARKYDGKPVFTGEVNIPMMCREVAKRLEELSEQPKADWIPCEVGDLIDKAFSHNEIVALWIEEATEDVRYDKRIWRGMAWDIPKVYKECKFIKIFGTVPESIVEADTINIRIELNEEGKDVLQRKATSQQITPAYEYKKKRCRVMKEYTGCNNCKYDSKESNEFPCVECSHNRVVDYYEPKTNADRIRNMTDEELAELMAHMQESAVENGADTKESIMRVLQAEVKEGNSNENT